MGYRGSCIGRIFLINQSQYQIVSQGALDSTHRVRSLSIRRNKLSPVQREGVVRYGKSIHLGKENETPNCLTHPITLKKVSI